jgi:hypothetical protein
MTINEELRKISQVVTDSSLPVSTSDVYSSLKKRWIYCPLSKNLVSTRTFWGSNLQKIDHLFTPLGAKNFAWQSLILSSIREFNETATCSDKSKALLQQLSLELEPKADTRCETIFERSNVELDTQIEALDIQDPSFLANNSIFSSSTFNFPVKVKWKTWNQLKNTQNESSFLNYIKVFSNFCRQTTKDLESPQSSRFTEVLFKHEDTDPFDQEDISPYIESIPSKIDDNLSVIERSGTTKANLLKVINKPAGNLAEHNQNLMDFSELQNREIIDLEAHESKIISIETPSSSKKFRRSLSTLLLSGEGTKDFKDFFSEGKLKIIQDSIANDLYEKLKEELNLDYLDCSVPGFVKNALQFILLEGIESKIPDFVRKYIPDFLIKQIPVLIRKGVLKEIFQNSPHPVSEEFLTAFCESIIQKGMPEACKETLIPHLEELSNEGMDSLYEGFLSLFSETPSSLQDVICDIGLTPGIGKVWCQITKQENDNYSLTIYSNHSLESGKPILKYEDVPKELLSGHNLFHFFRFQALPKWNKEANFSSEDFKESFLSKFQQYQKNLSEVEASLPHVHNTTDLAKAIIFKEDSLEEATLKNKYLDYFFFAFELTSTLSYLKREKLIALESNPQRASSTLNQLEKDEKTLIKYLTSQTINDKQFQVLWSTINEAKSLILNIHPQLKTASSTPSKLPDFWKDTLTSLVNGFGIGYQEIHIMQNSLVAAFGEDSEGIINEIMYECLESVIHAKNTPKVFSHHEFFEIQDFEDACHLSTKIIKQNLPAITWGIGNLTLNYLMGSSITLPKVSIAAIQGLLYKYHPDVIAYILPPEIKKAYDTITASLYEAAITSIIKASIFLFLDKEKLKTWWKNYDNSIKGALLNEAELDLSIFSKPPEESPIEELSRVSAVFPKQEIFFRPYDSNSHCYSLNSFSSSNKTHQNSSCYPFVFKETPSKEGIADILQEANKKCSKLTSLFQELFLTKHLKLLPSASLDPDSFWQTIDSPQDCLKEITDLLHKLVSADIINSDDTNQKTFDHNQNVILTYHCLSIIDCLSRRIDPEIFRKKIFVPTDLILFLENPFSLILDSATTDLINPICNYYNINRNTKYNEHDIISINERSLFNYTKPDYSTLTRNQHISDNYVTNLFNIGINMLSALFEPDSEHFSRSFSDFKKTPEWTVYESFLTVPSIQEKIATYWITTPRGNFIYENLKKDKLQQPCEALILCFVFKAMSENDKMICLFKNPQLTTGDESSSLQYNRILPQSLHLFRYSALLAQQITVLPSPRTKITSPERFTPHETSEGSWRISYSIKDSLINRYTPIRQEARNWEAPSRLSFSNTSLVLSKINDPTNAWKTPKDVKKNSYSSSRLAGSNFDPRDERSILNDSERQIAFKEDQEISYHELRLLELVSSDNEEQILKAFGYFSTHLKRLEDIRFRRCFELLISKASFLKSTIRENLELSKVCGQLFSKAWAHAITKNDSDLLIFIFKYNIIFSDYFSANSACTKQDFSSPWELLETSLERIRETPKSLQTEQALHDLALLSMQKISLDELSQIDLFRASKCLLYGSRQAGNNKNQPFIIEAADCAFSIFDKVKQYLDQNPEIANELIRDYFNTHYFSITDANQIKINEKNYEISLNEETTFKVFLLGKSPEETYFSKSAIEDFRVHVAAKYFPERNPSEIFFTDYLLNNPDQLTVSCEGLLVSITNRFGSSFNIDVFKPSEITLKVTPLEDIPLRMQERLFWNLQNNADESTEFIENNKQYWGNYTVCIQKDTEDRNQFLKVFTKDGNEVACFLYARCGRHVIFPEVNIFHFNREQTALRGPQRLSPKVIKKALSPLEKFCPFNQMLLPKDYSEELVMSNTGLRFSFKEHNSEVKAYCKSHLPDYFIAKRQNLKKAPMYNTLLLENEQGKKKVILNLEENLKALSFSLSSLNNNFGKVAENLCGFILNSISKKASSTVASNNLFIFDVSESGELVSQTIKGSSFLFLYHLSNQNLELAKQALGKIREKASISRMEFSEFRYLLLSSFFLLLPGDHQELSKMILEAFAIYQENCLLYESPILPKSAKSHETISTLVASLLAINALNKLENDNKPLEDSQTLMILRFFKNCSQEVISNNSKVLAELKDYLNDSVLQVISYSILPSNLLDKYILLSKKFKTSEESSVVYAKIAIDTFFPPQTTNSWERFFDKACDTLSSSNPLTSLLNPELTSKFSSPSNLLSTFLKVVRKSFEFSNNLPIRPLHNLILWCKRIDVDPAQTDFFLQHVAGSNLKESESYPPVSLENFDIKIFKERFLDYWRLTQNSMPSHIKETSAFNLHYQHVFSKKSKELLATLQELKGNYDIETDFLLSLLSGVSSSPFSFSNLEEAILKPFEERRKIIDSGGVSTSFLGKYVPFLRSQTYSRNEHHLTTTDGEALKNLVIDFISKSRKSYFQSLILNQKALSSLTNSIFNTVKESAVSKVGSFGKSALMQGAIQATEAIESFSFSGIRQAAATTKLVKNAAKATTRLIQTGLCSNIPSTPSYDRLKEANTLPQRTQESLKGLQDQLDSITDNFAHTHFQAPLLASDEDYLLQPQIMTQYSLNLDQEDSSIQTKLIEIQESLSDYYERPRTYSEHYEFFNEKSLLSLHKELYKEKLALHNQLQKEQEEIIGFVDKKLTPELSYEQKVVNSLTANTPTAQQLINFDDIFKIFLKGDFNEYASILKITSEEEIRDFEHKFYNYLITSTFSQKIDRALMITLKLCDPQELTSPIKRDSAVQKLVSTLKEKRVFTFDETSERLLRGNLCFEEKTGLMLWKKQYEQLARLLLNKNSSSAVEAIMGVGKTYYMKKALSNFMADGKTLLFNIWPDPVANTNITDIAQGSRHIFGQIANAKHINRSSFNSIDGLETFHILMQRCIDSRQQMNATQSDMQSLELKLFIFLSETSGDEFSDSILTGYTWEQRKRWQLFSNILTLIKEKGHASIDELHAESCPKREKNFPINEKRRLDVFAINAIHDVMTLCLTNPTISEMLNIAYNKQSLITKKTIEEDILPLIATTICNNKQFQIPEGKKQEIQLYLLGKLRHTPEFVLSHPKREDLSLLKGTLTVILPSCLGNISSVDSGLAKDFSVSKEFAVTYNGNDNPVENTMILDPIEALIKTYMMYAFISLKEDQIFRLVRRLQKQAALQAKKQNIHFEDTNAAKTCRRWGFELPKAELSSSQNLLNRQETQLKDFIRNNNLIDSLKDSPEAKLLFVKFFPSRQISYFPQGSTSNAINFMSMFDSSDGMSGSLYNKGCYYRDTKMLLDPGTTGESIDLLLDTGTKEGSINILESSSPVDSLREVFGRFLKQDPSFSAIIDAGALFRGISNKDIAKHLLELCKEERPGIKGIIYYNKDNNLVCLQEGADPIALSQSTLREDEVVSYFDHPHITAADIPQPFQAKAVVTVGEKTPLESGLLQAIWRMRGLKTKGQSLVLALPRDILKLIGSESPSMEEIIRFVTKNEEKSLQEKNFKADCNKVIDTFRREVLDLLLSKGNLEDALRIFNEFKELFIYTHTTSYFEKYGHPDIWNANPHEVIRKLKMHWLTKTEDSFSITFEIQEKIKEKLSLIGGVHASYPESTHSYDKKGLCEKSTLDQNQELSTDQDQNQDQNQDIEMDQNNNNSISSQNPLLESKTLLDEPIDWNKDLDCSDLIKIVPSKVKDIAYSLLSSSHYYLKTASKFTRPIFSLKDVFSNSSVREFRSIASSIEESVYICNSMIQLVGSNQQTLFDSKQRPWQYLIVTKPLTYSSIVTPHQFLITDTTGLKFWRKKIKEEQAPDIGIYSFESQQFIISNIDPNSLNESSPSLVKMQALYEFFSAKTNYEQSPTLKALKRWVKSNEPSLLRNAFDLIHQIHGERKFLGSSLEEVFDNAEEELQVEAIEKQREEMLLQRRHLGEAAGEFKESDLYALEEIN